MTEEKRSGQSSRSFFGLLSASDDEEQELSRFLGDHHPPQHEDPLEGSSKTRVATDLVAPTFVERPVPQPLLPLPEVEERSSPSHITEHDEFAEEDEPEEEIDEDEVEGEYSVKQMVAAAKRDATGKYYETGDEDSAFEAEQEDMEDFNEEMEIAISSQNVKKLRAPRKQKPKKGRAGMPKRLPADVQEMLGKANLHYINQEYEEAINIYEQVIAKAPSIHQAWVSLGLIYEELGDMQKGLRFGLVAAHLMPRDGDTWKRLGQMAREQGMIQEAIYCLGQAIKADPTDVDTIWDRAFLYKEEKKFPQAIRGFNKLLQLAPHHMNVVCELAAIYREMSHPLKGIALFEQEMDHFAQEIQRTGRPVGFSYTEVNMLAELYMQAGEYRKALTVIKHRCRLLQGRAAETHWDNMEATGVDNDNEYDENWHDRTEESIEKARKRADIPVELRVRMGQCRVRLNNINHGMQHYQYLFRHPVANYSDLYQEVAETFMEKDLYRRALDVFNLMLESEEPLEPNVYVHIGDCHRLLGNHESASEYYNAVLEDVPDHLDAKMGLAYCLEAQGEKEKAYHLIDQVVRANEIRASERRLRRAPAYRRARMEMVDEADYDGGRGRRKQRPPPLPRSMLDPEEHRRQTELQRQEKERDIFNKVQRIHLIEPLLQHRREQSLLHEYFDMMSSMVEEFRHHRRKQRNWSRSGQLDRETEREVQALEMAERLRNQVEGVKSESATEEAKSPSDFMGFSLTTWFELIIKYAIILGYHGRYEEAQNVLRFLGDTKSFDNDTSKKLKLKIALISCAVRAQDYETVCEVARSLCVYLGFNREGYRIYEAMFPGGDESGVYFASGPSQKFVMRLVKSVQEGRTGFKTNELRRRKQQKDQAEGEGDEAEEENELQMEVDEPSAQPAAGDAMDVDEPRLRDHGKGKCKDPVLLTLYGHILSFAKSYGLAIDHYAKAYLLNPTDPVICFSLGISLLHRAMQRTGTANRHHQIMQGFTFLMRYYRLREGSQEAAYNLARAFHYLDLGTLAVRHYERVFQLPSERQQRRSAKTNGSPDTTPIPPKEAERVEAAGGQVEAESLEPAKASSGATVGVGSPPSHEDEDDESDLRQEAAYNLAMLYSSVGSTGLAQMLLRKYCTI
ncbi:uncharacterized protein VTP21DRAFT_4937 [Calcarisporiella thermophila]|uniref:uncharacterized protein n=1 Tax=Calcarisporiella thermophila TaxID=911321 RepID=UPI0037424E9A